MTLAVGQQAAQPATQMATQSAAQTTTQSTAQTSPQSGPHEAGGMRPNAPPHLIPDLRVGDATNYFELYGQMNKGLLIYDDGAATFEFFPVDNDYQPTLAGLWLVGTANGGYTLGANLEAQWAPSSTLIVNQLEPSSFGPEDLELRKAEIYIKNDWGTVWLGHGNMSSFPSAQYDLSGTIPVSLSAVEDTAGGLFLRFSDGTLSDVQILEAFNNFNGLGRRLRVRYDTPTVNGVYVSTSVGTVIEPTPNDLIGADVALVYNNTISDLQLSGSVALSMPEPDLTLLDGSLSALHVPTGWSLTVAGAIEHTGTNDPHYGYAKLGYETSWFDIGKTAFSVEAYVGADIFTAGDHSTSVGAQVVQNVDYLQTQLYLSARMYQYDDATSSYETSTAVLTGAMVSF